MSEHPHADELAGHAHRHERGPAHAHPHHHSRETRAAHDHAHPGGLGGLTYICSPVHDLDARAKIIAVGVFIAGVVLSPAMRPIEFGFVVALLLAVIGIARLPLASVLTRSLLVLPFAGALALFAPLAGMDLRFSAGALGDAYAVGWPVMWAILSKAWLSASSALVLASTTPAHRLFGGLKALGIPSVFLTMLTFLHRYTDVIGDQLRSLRRAVGSRAPELSGTRLVRLYGNLAGNLFVRAFERGERVHAAMLSRGYDGSLPTAQPLRFGPAEVLTIACSLLTVSALLLY